MPVIGYSIPEHIPLIKDGTKRQTTRRPRADRMIQEGDRLYNYFIPRLKSGTCKNCLNQLNCTTKGYKVSNCPSWSNYFGAADVVHVERLREPDDNTFVHWSLNKLEAWAIADGFRDVNQADGFFTGQYGTE
ncbi:MAG: hypothetical protein QUS12_09780, partial [Methanosarcina sp.]|nr:hypothetical protein [Methanosarcina sp.]